MDAERIRPLTSNRALFSLPPVLKSTLRIWSPLGILLFALGVPAPGHAADPEKAPAAAQPEGAKAGADAKATPPGATPATDEKPNAATDKPKEAEPKEVVCKKVATALDASGKGMDSLSKEDRGQLVGSHVGQQTLLCLAVADGKREYCDNIMTDDAKQKCGEQFDFIKEIRGVPKERVKGRMFHKMCMQQQLCEKCGKTECDDWEGAVNTGDAAKCGKLPEPARTFCTALASRNPAKCSSDALKAHPSGVALCEAYVTEDAKRCPADLEPECSGLVSGFAVLRKQGLEGAKELDPSIAAATTGRDACKPLLAKFEKTCSEAK